MTARRWTDRGNGSWDLHIGDVTIQLAKEPKGWFFWGVVMDGYSFGERGRVPSWIGASFDRQTAPTSKEEPNA